MLDEIYTKYIGLYIKHIKTNQKLDSVHRIFCRVLRRRASYVDWILLKSIEYTSLHTLGLHSQTTVFQAQIFYQSYSKKLMPKKILLQFWWNKFTTRSSCTNIKSIFLLTVSSSLPSTSINEIKNILKHVEKKNDIKTNGNCYVERMFKIDENNTMAKIEKIAFPVTKKVIFNFLKV